MVFSSCFESFGLFLCSVPGLGQTQFNFNLAHSVHLGLLSQQRFFLDLQVKHPILDLFDKDFPSALGESDSEPCFFSFFPTEGRVLGNVDDIGVEVLEFDDEEIRWFCNGEETWSDRGIAGGIGG